MNFVLVSKPLFISDILSHRVLVVEYVENGGLVSYLNKNQVGMNQVIGWAKDISAGMSHLHAEEIIHRDLAARNLLLSESLSIKISDFG